MSMRSAFTLVEIMISIMIFTVVSMAMVGIMLTGAELFRRGEFSRSANDETVAVIGAIDDDLKHVVPSTGDGYIFSKVASASGNTLIAFATKQEAPDGVTARGLKSHSLVALWVDENGEPPEHRLRRVELDDTREIDDFITSLMVTAGYAGRRLTGWRTLTVTSIDDEGNAQGGVDSFSSSEMPEDLLWPARRIARAIGPTVRNLRFTLAAPYSWANTNARTGTGNNGATESEPLVVDVPAATLTQGCLHFSAWLALQDMQDMKRPRDANTHQPDWEQRTTTSTRLGPWSDEVYDTRPRRWTPQMPLNAAPFPTAVRFSLVLTGGGRFVPTGTLVDPLDSNATLPAAGLSFRITGLKSVPTIPGSMIRVGDEWITYSDYVNGSIKVNTSVDPEAKRGARRSTVAAHAQRDRVWMGQSYSLVRSLPK